MPRFFCTPDKVREDRIILEGPDVNHIKNVLRKKAGDELEISDGAGRVFDTEILSVNNAEIVLKIVKERLPEHELRVRITLYQGLPKQDKLDDIIRKSTELGVFRIVPTEMQRCVARWDKKKGEARLRRYNAIAHSAAEQSGRDLIPEVAEALTFKEALKEAGTKGDMILLPYENAGDMEHTREILENLKKDAGIAVFIGPEGGFEESEVKEASGCGAQVITLGSRILRTETAGPAVLSVLSYILE